MLWERVFRERPFAVKQHPMVACLSLRGRTSKGQPSLAGRKR